MSGRVPCVSLWVQTRLGWHSGESHRLKGEQSDVQVKQTGFFPRLEPVSTQVSDIAPQSMLWSMRPLRLSSAPLPAAPVRL